MTAVMTKTVRVVGRRLDGSDITETTFEPPKLPRPKTMAGFVANRQAMLGGRAGWPAAVYAAELVLAAAGDRKAPQAKLSDAERFSVAGLLTEWASIAGDEYPSGSRLLTRLAREHRSWAPPREEVI